MRPSGWFISVNKAVVATFIRRPVSTSDEASRRASARVFMKAPEPHLTSSTKESRFSASFLLMMLAVIRGIEGTVPVTSRKA